VKTLASPAARAVIALLLAAAAHPASDLGSLGTAGHLLLPLLALLGGLSLMLASLRAGAALRLMAVGVVITLGALGYDELRGRRGRLSLRPEQGTQTFEEEGPGGAILGLRPLGFDLQLQRLSPDGASLSVSAPAHVSPAAPIGPHQALAEGAWRLGWRRYEALPRLSIDLSRGEKRVDVDVSAELPASVGDLDIELDRYFPDFALDSRNQAYSRSAEPRNPAALLRVRQGNNEWTKVFVLREIPGLHERPDLGVRFSLNAVAMDERVVIGVHQEPAALAAALGVVLALLGLAMGVRR
jgi:hypothetical protein